MLQTYLLVKHTVKSGICFIMFALL